MGDLRRASRIGDASWPIRSVVTGIACHARNKPGGYWVAEANPDAAYHAVSRTWPLDEVAPVMAMTDGVSKAVNTYGFWPTWPDVYQPARHDPARVVDTIHEAEHSDPEGTRWPQSKQHDDKALAVVTFTAGPTP